MNKESPHWTPGTKIKIHHQPPALILSSEDGTLTCKAEDGSIFTIRPFALNWGQ